MLLTLNDVANRLNCSRATVRRMVDRGELEGVKIGLRGIRVKSESLERYLERHQIGGSEQDEGKADALACA
jgi:excisionase family DNA binding protein